MKKSLLLILGITPILVVGCLGSNTNTILNQNVNVSSDQNINTQVPSINTTNPSNPSDDSQVIAFFYQTVGLFMNGSGENTVRVGKTADGVKVDSYDSTVLDWTQSLVQSNMYGDPVFSRLANGNWAMTARNGMKDPRGSNYLLYHESSCPFVDDSAVVALGPSTAAGCKSAKAVTMGKTSQVFSDDAGKNYIFHMTEGSIYLTYLSDSTHSATSLDAICLLEEPVETVADLQQGEATLVLARGSGNNLLLSDTAIARRTDGTWVLFVKGREDTGICENGTLCELCSRSIYRTTSTDLVNWTELEEVVEQASVPEAITAPDGKVWVYWQDFSNTCAADDISLSRLAPISGAYEQTNSNELSQPLTVSFPDESFESDDNSHYATNGNPVLLPNAEAQADLEACLQ